MDNSIPSWEAMYCDEKCSWFWPPAYDPKLSPFEVEAVVSLLGAVALAAAAPFVIPLVFSEEFRGAVPLSVILVLGAFARNLSMLLNESMMGIGRPSAVMFSQWAGLGALVATAAVLIPANGVAGAAWAVVVGSVVTLVVVAALAWNWARSITR